MSDFGIVCEWNPFHNGHAHLLSEARRRGAERIVCVMSGCATQRGELAVADPYVRAEAALRCGADLVLQLPFPWSAGSAEYFGAAGVEILSDYADTLIFGSECGDEAKLRAMAKRAESEEVQQSLAHRLQEGERAATVFAQSVGLGEDISSNDWLGLSYLRAIERLPVPMRAEVVLRTGDRYRDDTVTDDVYPSAAAIRAMWRANQWEQAAKGMPFESARLFADTNQRGEIVDISRLDRAVLLFFRLHEGNDFAEIAEAGGGIANRICTLARECESAKALFEALRTKQYTDGRLRRAMLFCLTGVKQALLRQSPQYVLLLGANERGRALLAEKRKHLRIPLVTKPSDVPRDSEQFQVEAAIQALFTMAYDKPKEAGALLRKNAVIL